MGGSGPAGRSARPGGSGRAVGLLLALVAAIGASSAGARSHRGAASRRATRGPSITNAPGKSPWSQADGLIAEQRLQDAVKLLQRIQKTAQVAGREAEASRAAVRLAQLRMTLSNYEMAVTVLQDQLTWQAQGTRPKIEPADPTLELSRATLAMFYAQALVQYGQMYSFQVGQRERVPAVTGPDVPFVSTLRSWTTEELLTQTELALVTAWEKRAALGQTSTTALPEYVEPGTQPDLSRPTLRDFFTYQYVEFLASRQHWRADQQLGVPVSEIAALGRLDGAEATAARLLDAKVHPLGKLAAVLGDLAAWHQAAGRGPAMLAARLELWVRLHQAFADEPRRAVVRAQLGELVQTSGSGEGGDGAVAQATLAELLRTDFHDHPAAAADALGQAHALALQGAQRSSSSSGSSPGGQRCRAIVQALTAPEFHLDSMAVDGVGKRSLRVVHRNLPALHFRAYKYDPVQRLLAGNAADLNPTERELATLLRSGKPVAAWTTPLGATPDLQSHTTFVTPPLEELGGYLILASERADFALASNRLASVRLQLSDLVLWVTAEPDATRVTAVSGRTGEPLPDVEVALYHFGQFGQFGQLGSAPHGVVKPLQSARTGPDGSVELLERGPERDRVLVGRLGSQVTLVDGVPLVERERPGGEPAVLVYTDSSVYRAGQKLGWKLVAYRTATAAQAPRPLPAAPLGVTLVDADLQRVASLRVTTNQFGTASGEFTIPAGRRSGPWRLTTTNGGGATLYIEEPPQSGFSVTLSAPESPPRLGQPIVLRGEAHYALGAPVKTGRVRWQVTRRVDPRAGDQAEPGEPPVTLVATGLEAARPDGTFLIRFTPPAPARNEESPEEPTSHFQVKAELTDDSGETAAAQHDLHLGAVALHADINPEREFSLSGQPTELRITRRAQAGTPLAGPATWRLLRLSPFPPFPLPAEIPRRPAELFGRHGEAATAAEPVPAPLTAPSPMSQTGSPPSRLSTTAPTLTPGDRLRPRTDPEYAPLALLRELPDGPEQARGELTHGADGQAALRLAGLPAGVYRLQYQSRDAAGQPYQTSRELLVVPGPVAGAEDTLGLPALLLRERPRVLVGDTARFAVASARSGQVLFLEVRRAGLVTERRLLHAGRESLLIELPVQPTDRGGITVTLTAVIDHQLIRLAQSVSVPWDDHTLRLELTAFRDRLRPGAQESFRVTATTAAGLPAGPTELLAYMYDRRRDELAAAEPPDLLGIYPAQKELLDPTLTPRFAANLGLSAAHWQSAPPPLPDTAPPRPDRLRLSLNYRLGEVARSRQSRLPSRREPPEALTTPAPHPPFAPTAFFRPNLQLSAAGSTSVEFTVPDAAAAWNVVLVAVTPDLRVGMLTRPVLSLKELRVQPQVPHFLREGDRTALAALITNAASRPLSGQVRFEIFDSATGAELRPAFGLTQLATSLPFRLAPGDHTVVSIPVTAPASLIQATVRIVATAEALSDGEQRPLPILPVRRSPASVHEPAGTPAALVAAALPYLRQSSDAGIDAIVNRFFATSILAAARMPDAALSIPGLAQPARKLVSAKPTVDAQPQALEDELLGLARCNESAARPLARMREKPGEGAVPGDPDDGCDSLAQLRRAQTESGGFAWRPGGLPSPYWTLYVVNRLAQAAEFGAAVPVGLVRNAWWYLGDQLRERQARHGTPAGLSPEFLTFLNYAAATVPSARWLAGALSSSERQQLLQLSRSGAGQLSPLGTAQLAMTLKLMGQGDEGARLLLGQLDSAQAPAAAGTALPWLWFSDPVEGHAMVLRALLELVPAEPRMSGLVQGLLQRQSARAWKSTRTAAEVVYALCHYLKSRGSATVRPPTTATAYGSTAPQPGSELFAISRRYYLRTTDGRDPTLQPISEGTPVRPGDQIEVQLTLRSQHFADSVQLRDPRPAGLMPIGPADPAPRPVSDQGPAYSQELSPTATSFFFEELPAGQYTVSYRLRASAAGTFQVPPATVQPIAAPEFSSASPSAVLTMKAAPR